MEALANLDSDICSGLLKNFKGLCNLQIIWKRQRAVRAAHKKIFKTESRSPSAFAKSIRKRRPRSETGVVILFAPCAANQISQVSGRSTSARTASRVPGQFTWWARSSAGRCSLQRLRCSDGGGLRWRLSFRMRWRGFHIFLVEHNRPATFEHPLWSWRAVQKMALMLTGKMSDEVRRCAVTRN